MDTDVKISVAPFTGQPVIKVNITLQDEVGSPVIELLLEPWEARDLADELLHAANER